MKFLINRKSYAEDGKPQEIFEVTDLKKKRYAKKEYYENLLSYKGLKRLLKDFFRDP